MKNKYMILITTIILIIIVVTASILSNNKNIETNKNVININAKVEDIIFEEGKVNIYFFWGNGCPHCEEELEFLESINDEYNKYYNIYAFEVWYNQDNAELMLKLTEAMGDQARGVPYTIIGEKTFSGFQSSLKNEFKKTIKEQSVKSFDVYKNLK